MGWSRLRWLHICICIQQTSGSLSCRFFLICCNDDDGGFDNDVREAVLTLKRDIFITVIIIKVRHSQYK